MVSGLMHKVSIPHKGPSSHATAGASFTSVKHAPTELPTQLPTVLS